MAYATSLICKILKLMLLLSRWQQQYTHHDNNYLLATAKVLQFNIHAPPC